VPIDKGVLGSITIPLALYNSLCKDQKQLRNLEARGVDNWEGYSNVDWEEEDGEDRD
jgi:hypothetical protein